MRPLGPVAVLLVSLATASPVFATTWYQDADNDSYGNPNVSQEAPNQPPGFVINDDDCDDTNPFINPSAPEGCDGVDNDCDGVVDDNPTNPSTWYADSDADGWGDPSVSVIACVPPKGYVANGQDCDDSNASINPAAIEFCDGIDSNCNNVIDDSPEDGLMWFGDGDGDGFGDPSWLEVACEPPPGFVGNSDDCDDSNATIYPGATEFCDNIDNDCNGAVDDFPVDGTTWYEDSDGDGFGTSVLILIACSQPPGFADNSLDCNDGNGNVYPGAPELCDGLDNDCDVIPDDGCVPYEITSLADVGNDQGRRARVRWTRHGFDFAGSPSPISSYSVYRRIDGALATLGPIVGEPGNVTQAYPPGDWDFVVSVPAGGEASYSVVAGTLCDSTSSGVCWSVFFVRAHTASPTNYFDTESDSGYSIDNLAPNVPENFQVAYTPAANALSWTESQAADFRYFRVYRGASADFTPGPANLVHQTVGTEWSDVGGGAAHYKVTAVDFSGNESAAAVVSPTVGVEPIATAFALDVPSPNPSARDVAISFNVPAGSGAVRLQVLDAAGRLVRTLVDGEVSPGRNVIRWDGRGASDQTLGAGLYFVRLQSGPTVLRTKLIRAQ